jgi:hypothetical protein
LQFQEVAAIRSKSATPALHRRRWSPVTSRTASNDLYLAYDPLGRLGHTTQGAIVTQFLYDGDRLVAEYNGAGTLLRRYAHGAGVDEPVVWYEGAGVSDRRWLIADHQGSVIADTNGAGATSRYLHGSYGEPGPEGWLGSAGMHKHHRLAHPVLCRGRREWRWRCQ